MTGFIAHEYDPLAIGRPASAQVMDSIVGQGPRVSGSSRQKQ
jgi:hypothetical protein